MAQAILSEPVSTGNGLPGAMPILSLVNGHPRASSLAVAEHFKKRHDNVLRMVTQTRHNLPKEFDALNFEAVEYTDPKGENRPFYLMTRDGFALIVMGFTGKEAMAWKLRYIEAFNAMEAELARQQAPAAPTKPSPARLTTAKERNALTILINRYVGMLPGSPTPETYKAAWRKVHDVMGIKGIEELTVEQLPRAVMFVQSMVDAWALPKAEQPKALPAAAKPLSTIRDYASIFGALPDMSHWRDLSRRLLRAHDAFQGELDAIKKDALRPFRENRRIEVATFLDSATVDGYKRMFEIAEDGQHVAYRGAYGALLGLEGLHDLLVRG